MFYIVNLLIACMTLYNTTRNISALVTAWTTGSNAEAEAALNQYIDWTPAAAQALEESVRSGNLLTICGTDQSVSII